MEFYKTNIDTANKREVYRMTEGESLKIEGLEKGLSLPVDKYAYYGEPTGEDGKVKNILTFTSGPHKFGTISATFVKSFLRIVEIMGDEHFAIIITGGESKNGRKYVNCELDCDWYEGETTE